MRKRLITRDFNSAHRTGRCNGKPAMDQWGIARLTEAVRECEGIFGKQSYM